MAEIRTLKLNLLADIDQFQRGLNNAKGDVNNFGYTVGKVTRKMAQAFAVAAAAAGALAVKIGVDSVKAAVEDEQSQVQLAKALQNTTNATDAQIKSTEKWISSQQLSYGVSDSQLRPALANLARATGDVGKAQQLTTLALDIATATGKDLETVSLSLGKAYNGNIGALTKLGIPLDENIKKTKDFDLVQQKLTDLFGGAAAKNAETYAGQLAILSQKTSELKEGFGVILLPAVQSLVNFANDTLLPTLSKVSDGFAGKPDSVSNKLKQVGKDMGYAPDSGAYNLGKALSDVAQSFMALFKAITSTEGEDSVSTLQSIANSLERVAGAIDAVANAYTRFQNLKVPGLWGQILGKANQGRAIGGSVSAGQAYTVGEMGKEVFVPNTSGRIVPNNQIGGNVTINLNGIIDAESARRSIEKLLQNSARRTGAINLVGATL